MVREEPRVRRARWHRQCPSCTSKSMRDRRLQTGLLAMRRKETKKPRTLASRKRHHLPWNPKAKLVPMDRRVEGADVDIGRDNSMFND